MPQLDTATFFGQVTWLVIVFGVLYRATRGDVLPKLSRIVKMRSKKRDRTRVDATQYDGERTRVESGYSSRLGNAANSSHGLLQETMDVQTNWRNTEVVKRNQSQGMKGARNKYRSYRMQAKLADVYISEALTKVDGAQKGKTASVAKTVKKVGKKETSASSARVVKKTKGAAKVGKKQDLMSTKTVSKDATKAKTPTKGNKKGTKK
jgi:hypothetical protein